MDSFDRYQKQKRIGGGENSQIFLCHDQGRQVVIKVFRVKERKLKRRLKKGDFNYAENRRLEFIDEATLTSSFHHPHIIKVLETNTLEDGRPYFVMPYHPGNLATELWGSLLPQKVGQKFEPERVVILLRQILSALSEIHRHGVVHRDLKPQNILLDEKKNAVLCDFGHAKNPSAVAPPRKRSFGTPPFITPEQRSNPDTVDGSADIYSLGVMAYIMVTGVRPGDSSVPPNKLDTTIDTRLSDWIMQTMNRDPKNRPDGFVSPS